MTQIAVPNKALRTRTMWWVALLVLGLSGCASKEAATTPAASSAGPATSSASPSPSTTDSAGADSAGAVVTDDVNGFSITVPVGHTRIEDMAMLDSMTADASVDPADQKHKARLVQYIPTIEHARVFAFKRGADFNDNFNVLATSTNGLAARNIDDLFKTVKGSVERQLDGTEIGYRVITVSGTKAMRMEYRTHAGPIPLRGTQVWVNHNGAGLVLTISQNDAPTAKAEADKIIDSLRLDS